MGIFDFLKKEKNEIIRSIAPAVLERGGATDLNLIHRDIQSLIWVENGPKKNYVQSKDSVRVIKGFGYNIILDFSVKEPSVIDIKLPLGKVNDITRIERPPYFPTYENLTNEQRSVYWELLRNPYNSAIDIGYVFILYYGLERHLFEGEFEEAFEVVLKLRDIHSNGSFQSYSARALVLSCLFHQRADLVNTFLQSLDKEYEKNVPSNLLLLCKYSMKVPLTADEIMRSSKDFEFTNLNYIKKHPDIFKDKLTKLIFDKFNANDIDLSKVISSSEFNKIKLKSERIFANTSISEKGINVPNIVDSFKFKKEIYSLLEMAHNNTKEELAKLRKTGNVPVELKASKDEKIIIFDTKIEKELLNQLSKAKTDLLDRHFIYISLQNFYYKYRKLDEKYLDECVRYCELDLRSLNYMSKTYLEKKHMADSDGKFVGNIPAFKRLAIIYEKNKEYEKAISICESAIKFGNQSDGTNGGFELRIEKLKNKIL